MIVFNMKVDKTTRSSYELQKDDQVIKLTEKDLDSLLEQIEQQRPDAVENMPAVLMKNECIKLLEDETANLKEEIRSLETDLELANQPDDEDN